MKVFFMRHGESKSQAKQISATDPDSLNGLTDTGFEQVRLAAQNAPEKIDAVYASPYNRTMLTAKTFLDTRNENTKIVIDERLREIDYGFHGSDDKKHPYMIEVATRQIAGDYEVRFGHTGENKREIITRFFSFLVDVFNNHNLDDVVLAVSHGRAISILNHEFGALNDIVTEHGGTKNASLKEIELNPERIEKIMSFMDNLNADEIKRRCDLINSAIPEYDSFKPHLLNLAHKYIDDIDVSYNILDMFVHGLYKSEFTHIITGIKKEELSELDVVLITAIKDSAPFLPFFIEHYVKIGITKFAFIDNNSTDNSVNIIQEFSSRKEISVDIWHTNDTYNGIKLMGWRNRLMKYYGLGHWYICVDSDELLVCEQNNIHDLITFLKSENVLAAGAVMIDLYPKASFKDMTKISNKDIINEYRFFDKCNYTYSANRKYKYRVFGGSRYRMFKITPSLQKFPVIFATPDLIGINPHFWHPYNVNNKAKFNTGLLHYKFLPNHHDEYAKNAEKGLYYNNSSEYKVYVAKIEETPDATFYDVDISKEYTGFDSIKPILE